MSIGEKDVVMFVSRGSVKSPADRLDTRYPLLDAEPYHAARIVAPGYDVYRLECEWQRWWADSGRPELHDPDKPFISFCRSGYERNRNL